MSFANWWPFCIGLDILSEYSRKHAQGFAFPFWLHDQLPHPHPHPQVICVIYMMTSSNGSFPRYWPLCGVSPVNSPHKGYWRGALIFFFICAWTNVWVNNRDAGDLRRHRAYYDVIVIIYPYPSGCFNGTKAIFRSLHGWIITSTHIYVYNLTSIAPYLTHWGRD